MSKHKQIREYLAVNPGVQSAQCAEALGLPYKLVSDALGLMWRNKNLIREGQPYHYFYSVNPDYKPRPPKVSPEEARARYNANRQARRARQRGRETPKRTQTFTSAPKARPFKHEISTPKPPVVQVRAETIDEWMQRTGAKPERLADTNQFQNLRPSDIRALTPAYVR